MPAIGIGIGVCFTSAARQPTVSERLLALTPEALWLPDHGETLDGLNRVEAAPDLTANAHDLAQAAAGSRPLLSGSKWVFDKARPDLLTGTAIALGVAAYTVAAVFKIVALPGVGEYQTPLANGTLYVDGQMLICQNAAGFPETHLYHWGPGVTANCDATPDTTLHSEVIRWNGTHALPRVRGVDAAPIALAAAGAPAGPLVVGAWSAAGASPAHMELHMLAIFARSLSAGDMTTLSAIITAGWGVA